jgi:hypothetical protein
LPARQLALFQAMPHLPASVRRAPPRMWVRRLVLWHDLAQRPFRDVPLHRGMNIIWSPSDETPEDDRLPAGHAAGKSLFCRALRFCLGEDTFASADDADTIRASFPQGGVGAEVVVEGAVWAVRRPFVGRGDLAVADGDLLDLTGRGGASAFDLYLSQLQGCLGPPERVGCYPKPDGHHPWRFALAWLTRDQECRVEGITSWRHKETDSGSPVRPSSADDRLTVLRLALGLYDLQARARATRISRAVADLEKATRDQAKAAEREEALIDELATALDLSAEDVAFPPWSSAEAREPHRKALIDRATSLRRALLKVAPPPAEIHPDDLRLEALDRQLAEKSKALESVTVRVEDLRKERSGLAEKEPGLYDAVSEAKRPTCPYDGAPLNVLKSQEQCPLVKFPVLDEVKHQLAEAVVRRKEVEQLLRVEEPALTALAGEHSALQSQRDRLGRAADRRRKREEEALADRDRQTRAVMGARTLIDSLFDRTEASHTVRERVAEWSRALHTLRDDENEARKQQDVAGLFQWFLALVQRVLGADASGRIRLDGNGLHAEIDRHSVALDALKVVLFDLSAMLLAADGKAHIPAFLLHDSPREGDLDLSTYRRIFRAIHEIAPEPDEAPFQYIITTTSGPPEGAAYEHLVRLKLRASPAAERFLGVDL